MLSEGREEKGSVERMTKEDAAALLRWFDSHRRILPWREDPTPYHVWVSEIMLQQTRVDTVIPYYERFIREIPDVRTLAGTEEQVLTKLFEGLGYYSRVRNMKKAAAFCTEHFGGELPAAFGELLLLPGIGRYTAGAIASIAYGLPYPVADGNVLRVYSRLTGSRKDIKDPVMVKEIETVLRELLLSGGIDPSRFNQGLMELGALICLPNGAPKCGECPLRDSCTARQCGTTSEIPVKSAGKARKREEKTVLFIFCGDRILLRKPPESGLLAGLYALPEAGGFLSPDEVPEWLKGKGLIPLSLFPLGRKKHIFTHREWLMEAYRAEVLETDGFRSGHEELFFRETGALSGLAFPQAYKKWDIL